MIQGTNTQFMVGKTISEENVTAFLFVFPREKGFGVWVIVNAMFCTM